MISVHSHPALILKERGMSPLKSFGQNFLINTHSFQPVIDSLVETDTILEVGPGLGKITTKLLENSNLKLVIEKDIGMSAWLHDQFPSLTIVNEDFLKTDPELLKNCNSLVSNLPFYITSAILKKLIYFLPMISKSMLGMQKEVGERLVVGKGSSLALFLAAHGEMKILARIPRSSFYPVPKVDGVWLQWSRRDLSPIIGTTDEWELLLRGSFWGKRKKISTNWKKNPFWLKNKTGKKWLEKIRNKIPDKIHFLMKRRADSLILEDFCEILFFLNS